MKHEPRPAIHMEKQLLKLGGAESLGMSKLSQTVITKLMGPQMWHQLAGSMGGAIRKGTMTSAHLDARHFSFSLYATGVFQAATLVLEPRSKGSE